VKTPKDPGEAVGFLAVAPLLAVFNFPKVNIGVSYSLDL
jgi:hypothetical protein